MKNRIIRNIKDLGIQNRKLLTSFEQIFSDKVGIVNALLMRKELLRFGFHMYQTLSANSTVLFGNDREVSSGGLGISKNKEIAVISSFFESIERYCMSCTNKKYLHYSHISNIPEHLRPTSFSPYSSAQYKANKQFKNPKKDKISWVKLTGYTDHRKSLYWPASLVYLPFSHDGVIAETSSTGVAANITIKKAVASGLLELIERDAMMLNFGLPIKQKEIDLDSIRGTQNWSTIMRIISSGFSIKLYKLYSDIDVPVYMGYIWKGSNNKFHFGVRGCANLKSDTAIEKVLKECLFSYFYSKNILDLKQNDKNKIKHLYEHFLYYQDEKMFQKLLKRKKDKIKYSPEKLTGKDLLKRISETGHDVYYFDLTTPDVNSFCKVVKVVVPGLIDLNKSHSLPRLGETRYKIVKSKLGIKGKLKLSANPHPFP